MELIAEIKLEGDGYAGGFSCGLSMCRSKTIENFKKVNETETKICYENAEGVLLTVYKQKENEVMHVWTEIENHSADEITMEMLASFALKNVVADKIHRIQSFWSAEGRLRTETIEELNLECSWNGCATRIEKFGNVGSMPVRKYFPFLALEDSTTGTVLGIQLYCASSWQMEISCKEDQNFLVTGGIADGDFGQWKKKLLPEEKFITPKAIIAQGSSLEEVCDSLVKAQHPMISSVDSYMGIAFNEYCTTWGNPSIENVKKICDQLVGKGIQYLVIDSGWYGNSERWWDLIGDWEVNREKFPNGLKEAADYIRSKGMIPGLWFEIESVTEGSRYYEAKEHLIHKDGEVLSIANRRFWDMEDSWVISYLSQKVIMVLKECGFGYLKIDYNDTIGMGCDGGDSLGDGLYRKVEASRRFFDKIRQEVPGIVIENCSSGGHRLEPSMMQLVSQASFSDAHETKAIPLIAANLHRVIRPEQSQIWVVLRAGDSDERIYYSLISAFLGRMCLSGDIYELSKEQWRLVEEGIEFYRQVSEIIRNGKTVLNQSNTTGYNYPKGEQMVIREWKNYGLVVLHRFENSKEVTPLFPVGSRIIAEYGRANQDFSAKAWIYEK